MFKGIPPYEKKDLILLFFIFTFSIRKNLYIFLLLLQLLWDGREKCEISEMNDGLVHPTREGRFFLGTRSDGAVLSSEMLINFECWMIQKKDERLIIDFFCSW